MLEATSAPTSSIDSNSKHDNPRSDSPKDDSDVAGRNAAKLEDLPKGVLIEMLVAERLTAEQLRTRLNILESIWYQNRKDMEEIFRGYDKRWQEEEEWKEEKSEEEYSGGPSLVTVTQNQL
jgi:hypothetical protein